MGPGVSMLVHVVRVVAVARDVMTWLCEAEKFFVIFPQGSCPEINVDFLRFLRTLACRYTLRQCYILLQAVRQEFGPFRVEGGHALTKLSIKFSHSC